MKASDVIEIVNDELDDTTDGTLWTEAIKLKYLSEAQQEACMRADLIWDTARASVQAEATKITIDSKINRIVWAGWDDGTTVQPLEPIGEADADRRTPKWRTYTGVPTHFIQKPRAVRLYYPPAAAGTLRMEVYRQPLVTDLTMGSDLEIPDRWAPLLRHWVQFRAYTKRDAETEQLKRAAANEALFTAAFGARPTVYAQVERQQRRSNVVRPRGF